MTSRLIPDRTVTNEGLNAHEPARGNYCFPNWLERLLRKEDVGWRQNHHYIFDHERHAGPIAFCEPYGAGDKDFEFLVAFCRKNNLRFSVTGHSNHFVGQTFRLVIWRPQDDDKAQDVCCHVRVGE